MSFWSFLKNLFGADKRPASPSRPMTQASALSVPLPVRAVTPGVLVHRDEIIDTRLRIAGYRFRASFWQSGEASGAMACAALLDDAVPAFAQQRLALIALSPRDWQEAGYARLAAPLTCFLVASPALGESEAAWFALLAEIRATGARVCLDAETAQRYPHALTWANQVLFDFRLYPLERFETRVRALAAQHANLDLLVEGVATWEEYRLCMGIGIHHALGAFAATPDEAARQEKLSQSRMVLIELLNLLRDEADLPGLAEAAKRDPGVVAKLVEMANSPLSGLSVPVAGLDQALMVIGRDHLYRWLSLGIYRVEAGARDGMLLELALCRARLLELVATDGLDKRARDELFLVGMFSVFDSLLGMPMEQIVAHIHLPSAVANALVNSEGPYGAYLSLALAVEKGRGALATRLAGELGLPLPRLAQHATAARAWTESALKAA